MKIINNTLKNYLKQLIVLGFLALIMGISLGIVSFYNLQSSWIYIPITLVGAGFGYYIAAIKVKGGTVNYYLNPHIPTENEKFLDKLIAENRNNFLITLIAAGITLIELALEFKLLAPSNTIRFDYLIGSLAISIISVAMTSVGVKYITAWWNIKKKYEK
jgi:hypothetical protein